MSAWRYDYTERRLPAISEIINRTRKTTNNTLATPAKADAMLRKPNMPATMANTKKINAQPNILITFLIVDREACYVITSSCLDETGSFANVSNRSV